jgi:hypothetical protein
MPHQVRHDGVGYLAARLIVFRIDRKYEYNAFMAELTTLQPLNLKKNGHEVDPKRIIFPPMQGRR